jgi:hypothetical protein
MMEGGFNNTLGDPYGHAFGPLFQFDGRNIHMESYQYTEDLLLDTLEDVTQIAPFNYDDGQD